MGSLQGSLFPITVPGAIIRHTPAGDPTIEQYYHKSMEDGRLLEASVGDANNQLLELKMAITREINAYLSMNQLAVDGQLGHHARVPKYIADSIKLLQQVHMYQTQLTNLATAIQSNITLLLTMKNTLLSMVQSSLNALANLLNNICNWNLPKLPSLPVLLGGHFNWNGFQFSPLQAFAKSIGNLPNFNFNFSFSQCNLLSLANNPTTQPTSITTLGGLIINPSALFTPPLDGSQSPVGQDLTDPSYIAQMQAITSPPVYGPSFNPNSSMLGALPDPHTIISNYQMPPSTYQSNIVSIVPALRGDTIEPTDDDYTNPNLVVRQTNLRKDLVHYITLQQVVASNYDPFITSAWLFYLQICRNGRGGNWLASFQAAYNQYIVPSLTSLANNPVPWNNVLGSLGDFYEGAWDTTVNYLAGDVVVYNSTFYIALAANTALEPDLNLAVWQTPTPNGIVYQNTPTDIPLIDTLVAAGAGTQAQLNILWKLSYVEASLLGYTRTTLWDGGGDSIYLSSFTSTDLDYVPTTVGTTTTSEILGSGTAAYPVSVIIPTSIKAIFDEVVAQATLNIANDTTYQSPYPKFKYIYDQFATASLVDRFTQFWRTFNYNLLNLLAQDPYLVSFVATYEGALDSAIDPLGDPTDYNAISTDAASRNRSWTPGTPLLNIPTAPVVAYSNIIPPTTQTNGWTGTTELNANAFLMRPDVQALPIPTQIAMLRTNISFAGLNLFMQQATAEFDNQIATAQSILASLQQLGFYVIAVNDTTSTTSVPVAVAFDQIEFDITGNVTNPTTYTIQAAGDYAGYGQVVWDATEMGNYTVTVTQNGVPIYTVTTDPTASPANPLTVPFSFTGNFAVGDVVQVLASQNTGINQSVLPTSYFSMLQASTTPVATTALVVTDEADQFTSDAPISSLVVVSVQPDGTVAPVDPFIPLISDVQIVGPNTVILTVNAHNFAAGDLITFAGVLTATFINGQAATVQAVGTTPTQITATFATYTHGTYPATGDTGYVLYAVDDTGVVLAPFPDGITTAASGSAQGTPTVYPVPVATEYGGLFSVSGASFIVGGLLYAGIGGYVTQDFASLLNGGSGSPPGPAVGWIICVGRAISATEFLYEPHIPTRFASFF
jgi:hypothetical protein